MPLPLVLLTKYGLHTTCINSWFFIYTNIWFIYCTNGSLCYYCHWYHCCCCSWCFVANAFTVATAKDAGFALSFVTCTVSLAVAATDHVFAASINWPLVFLLMLLLQPLTLMQCCHDSLKFVISNCQSQSLLIDLVRDLIKKFV